MKRRLKSPCFNTPYFLCGLCSDEKEIEMVIGIIYEDEELESSDEKEIEILSAVI